MENFRDLGGLPLRGGGVTRSRAIWRSGHLDRVDAAGWAELRTLGITTVVDLRNPEERAEANDGPDDIQVLSLPLEDTTDPQYFGTWNNDWATPDFSAWGRVRWPVLWSAVLTAIAEAPGGVLVHCAAGRDRTGLVSALLLETAGVERAAVLEDYVRGIRESSRHDIDEHVEEYSRALGRLLDDLHSEPELRRAAAKLG
ncbi:MAG: tyrosine-protein phosphatase [Pseudolysinimonas sp.]